MPFHVYAEPTPLAIYFNSFVLNIEDIQSILNLTVKNRITKFPKAERP